jgi:hypothetical protein
VPPEDLGVRPDLRHDMTRGDVLGSNDDLIARARRVLAELPGYRLSASLEGRDAWTIAVTAEARGLTRLDARPLQTVDVRDGPSTFSGPHSRCGPEGA